MALKLALLGAAGAGKTALARRLATDAACDGKPRAPTTTALRVRTAALADTTGITKPVVAAVWDCPAALTLPTEPGVPTDALTHLLDGAAGVVLVYDVTRRSTFDALVGSAEQGGSAGLATMTRALAPGACTLLVGTHSDLEGSRSVPAEVAQAFTAQHGGAMFFLEVSSLDGANVDLLRTLLRLRLAHARARGRLPPRALPDVLPSAESDDELEVAATASPSASFAATAPSDDSASELACSVAAPAGESPPQPHAGTEPQAAGGEADVAAPPSAPEAVTTAVAATGDAAAPATIDAVPSAAAAVPPSTHEVAAPAGGAASEEPAPASEAVPAAAAAAPKAAPRPSVLDRFKPQAQKKQSDAASAPPQGGQPASRGGGKGGTPAVLARFGAAAKAQLSDAAVAAPESSSSGGGGGGGVASSAPPPASEPEEPRAAKPAPQPLPGGAPHVTSSGAAGSPSIAASETPAVPATAVSAAGTPALAPPGYQLVTVIVAGPDGLPVPMTLPMLVGQALPPAAVLVPPTSVVAAAAPAVDSPLSPIHKRLAGLKNALSGASLSAPPSLTSSTVAAGTADSQRHDEPPLRQQPVIAGATAVAPATSVAPAPALPLPQQPPSGAAAPAAAAPAPSVVEVGTVDGSAAVVLVLDVAVGGKSYGGCEVTRGQAGRILSEAASALSPPSPTALALARAFVASVGLEPAYAPKLAAVLLGRLRAMPQTLGHASDLPGGASMTAAAAAEPATRDAAAAGPPLNDSVASVATAKTGISEGAASSTARGAAPSLHTSVRAGMRAKARSQQHRPPQQPSQLQSSASLWPDSSPPVPPLEAAAAHVNAGPPRVPGAHAGAGSFPHQPQLIDRRRSGGAVPTPSSAVIARLHVEVAPQHHGILEVRADAEPTEAVRAFLEHFPAGVVAHDVAAQLAQLVAQQLRAAARAAAPADAQPARRRPGSSSSPPRRPQPQVHAAPAAPLPAATLARRMLPETRRSVSDDAAMMTTTAGAAAAAPASSLSPRLPAAASHGLGGSSGSASSSTHPVGSAALTMTMMPSRGLSAAISAAATASGRAAVGPGSSGGSLTARTLASHSPGSASALSLGAQRSEPPQPQQHAAPALAAALGATAAAAAAPGLASVPAAVAALHAHRDATPAAWPAAAQQQQQQYASRLPRPSSPGARAATASPRASSPSRIPALLRGKEGHRPSSPPAAAAPQLRQHALPHAGLDLEGDNDETLDEEDARADVAAAAGAGLTAAQQRLLALTLRPGSSSAGGGARHVSPLPTQRQPAAAAARPTVASAAPAPPQSAVDPVEGGVVWFVDAAGEPLAPGAPAFNLDVDVGRGPGVKARLVVLQGAAVSAMAAQFLALNGLPQALAPRVSALVQQAARAHQVALMS